MADRETGTLHEHRTSSGGSGQGTSRNSRDATPQLVRDERPTSVSSTSHRSPHKQQNRVHFTPEPHEASSHSSPHHGESLEEPIPPRRPPQGGSTSYTPVSPSPALVRPPTQHYEAPSHHGHSADVANNVDYEVLEKTLAGATWDHPANILLRVVTDFEPCCSVELRAYQGQHITGLFQNGAWIYVRATNGAEGYLPAGSCALTKDRPPSIDISSSGVSSVGTVEDEVSNGGRSYSSLERGVHIDRGSMSSSTGIGVVSPDSRTSAYLSEPEKSSSRVKFAPTASILEPGYRRVQDEYVAMYKQRPRTASASGWQSNAASQRSPPFPQQQQPYTTQQAQQSGGGATSNQRGYGPGELSRTRNQTYPQGRTFPGPPQLGPSSAPGAGSPQALAYDSVKLGGQQSSQSSRSRRLIDRLKNFRGGTAQANEVFEVGTSPAPGGQGAKDLKKDGKKKKQAKKGHRQKEYVTSDTELSTPSSRNLAAPLGRRGHGSSLTDTEDVGDRQLHRLDLAGFAANSGTRGGLNVLQGSRAAFNQPHFRPMTAANDPLLSNPRSRKSVATSRPSQRMTDLGDENDVMMVTSFVLYDFEAQQDEQLSVKRGQPVWKIYAANDVIKAGEVGWIFVMDPESKQKGFIPQACLQPLPSSGSLAVSRALGAQAGMHNG